MAIKINLNTTVIPVEIGTFKFEINMTDEKEKAFQEKINDFLKQAQTLNEDQPEEEKALRNMVEEMFDTLLENGAFEKLYNHTPNIGILLGVLMDLIASFGKEARNRVIPNSALKVLEKKVKKSEKTGEENEWDGL